ncbi:SgcJ/EcaC family oxidoreductase [Kineosporia babensis]|uniref:SgcJ/EcaC family oxidoreductase n=1 Tax=Kineosporia babensis TaxID=499548 RepID=A0A9X1NDV6_9ACTN|nr:SgcJ/EcaC family oxidoreductase [Kineosporia babensis]MCD5311253.1 SgcJ/EcaC family oxidoreductase [Kineosporia babensis]
MEQTVETLSAVASRMGRAWNDGDAAGFFADFAEDGKLVEFEGTIGQGRQALVQAQTPLFETVLKGSRLVDSSVEFAEIVQPGVGIVHHRAVLLMAGETDPLPTRYLSQLYVLHWRDERWQIVALHNSRVLSFRSIAQLDALAG